MFKTLKKFWRYLGAMLGMKFEDRADPRVQLEQALVEAQEQHRLLKEQAANVIATQKTTEMQLNRRMEELEKADASARQAVLMADEAGKRGEAAKSAEYAKSAEAFANRLIAVEEEVTRLKAQHLQASAATDQAKAAVQQNSAMLQKRITEKQQLLGKLEQAKMQEQMNKTMAQLTEVVGGDIPSVDEVRTKIEARYAKALGAAELNGESVEARMLEVEQASMNVEAQARLEQIRAQLGLPVAAPEVAPVPVAETQGASA